MLRLHTFTMLRLLALIVIAGLFFGLANGQTPCSPQTSTCSSNCRTNPSIPYSTNSNGGTTRAGDSTWYINGYQFNGGYPSDSSDQVKSNRFMGRYGYNSTSPRVIQQKINELAKLYPEKCSSTCEDGRFGNDTIEKMSSCLCADADAGPINFGGSCGDGFESDGKNCCKCKSPSQSPTSGNCSSGYVLNNGCCTVDCQSLGKQTPPCPSGFLTGADGCCEPPVGCTTPVTGGSCLSYGSGRGEDPNQVGCCKEICKVFPDGSGNCQEGFSKGSTGGIAECCNPAPNNCTGKKYGVRDSTGQSYSCTDCGTGKMADETHTKCVCDPSQGCCGIELNTVVPFIGDCIEMSDEGSSANTTRVNPLNAFPRLMGGLSRILVTAILVLSFVMVVVGGVMIIAGGIKESNFSEGKKYIRQVVIGLILLGASGIILRLINPNFFG